MAWLVDPIDGQVNFLYDIPQFAVSLARVGPDVVAGVVHNPIRGDVHGVGRRWRLSQRGPDLRAACTELAQALVGTGFTYLAEVRAHQAVSRSRGCCRSDAHRGGWLGRSTCASWRAAASTRTPNAA